ncbi:hypothetical protein BBJ28_00006001 [Nothophytophthora sp. Chile5]|nr:hypothetical protein BBJ28_00006001 [Nothophytophthora sp. Chile5]
MPSHALDHASLPPSERILALLDLDRSSSASELRAMVSTRFRPPQQFQLAGILQTMETTAAPALTNVAAWFSNKFDAKDEVEHYLQDLIRMHHYIAAHDRQHQLRSNHMVAQEPPERSGYAGGTAVARELMLLFAAFPDSRDRHLVTKIYQTLGLSCAITYCLVARTLTFKHQKELLDLFAEDLPELRVWMSWLDGLKETVTAASGHKTSGEANAVVSGPGYEVAVNFMGRTIREHCVPTWLELLRPLDTPVRLVLIEAIDTLLVTPNAAAIVTTTGTLKKLGRFYETTGIPVQKLLELDVAVRYELPLLLEEFPTISLITLFAKFNSEKMIQLIVKRGLPYLPKTDLLRLLDALAPADITTIEVFVVALFSFGNKKINFLLLFLTFSMQNQLRFLDLVEATANPPSSADTGLEEQAHVNDNEAGSDTHESCADRNCLLFKFFVDARFNSVDGVIQKLSALPKEFARQMVHGMAQFSAEELVLLGQGLELAELPCLEHFLRLFLIVQPELQKMLVAWVEDIPGEESLPVYHTLLSLYAANDPSSGDDEVGTVLRMLSDFQKKDKVLLCRQILAVRPGTQMEGANATPSPAEVHAKVLLYLCECELSRHKMLHLLRVIPFEEYDRLLFLLRTQRMPEQVSLTRLMLSMPSDANCRLLAKVSLWSTDVLDAFFQLLLMLPKVEYKMLAKLMASLHVSAGQLEVFVTVAVDMMNQASSRELVIFAAELPAHIRNLFFDMLVGHPEKGVLLRIVSYSTRVTPDLMNTLVELFHRMSWEIRSAFIEQLRGLDGSNNVQNLADVACKLEDDESLRQLVLLLNPLPTSVQTGLVALFLQLNVRERSLMLSRLVEIPKGRVGAFCGAICNPVCASVTTSFCRVLGLVDAKHQASLLRLLESEPLWFFLRLMADYCETGPNEGASEGTTTLLNQVAALLELFSLEEHYLVLRGVMWEALANAMSLDEVVAVLGLFPEAMKLLDFLRYVDRFAKYTRSSLLFRVLSKYQQPAFIFEMCRILDLDDAVFALKRLDRMWLQRHTTLVNVDLLFIIHPSTSIPLIRLAGGNMQAKDDFCDLILGFWAHSTTSKEDKANTSLLGERIVTPRSSVDPSAQSRTPTEEINADEDPDCGFRLPTTTPPSHQPVPLDRHLQRTKPNEAFPRKRSDRKAWWQDLDDIAALLPATDRHNEISGGGSMTSRLYTPEQEEQGPNLGPQEILPSVFALTEQPFSTRSRNDTEFGSNTEDTATTSTGLLPLIAAKPAPARSAHHSPLQDDCPLTVSCHPQARTDSTLLNRSESAPTTLSFQDDSEWDKSKRCRGLVAALDDPPEFPVRRNRGASYFQLQRKELHQNVRIGYAKTPAAQTLILDARVCRATGQRSPSVTTSLSPLVRPDLHTMERATTALMASMQFREAATRGFVAEPPIRGPAPIKQHRRMLPVDATERAKATTTGSSTFPALSMAAPAKTTTSDSNT